MHNRKGIPLRRKKIRIRFVWEKNITIKWINVPPPPAVVLATELKVDHHNGDLGAGDDEDDEDEEEEPEQVVELVLVDSGEDEEELDEAGAKGQDARHQGAHGGVHVPQLGRNLRGKQLINQVTGGWGSAFIFAEPYPAVFFNADPDPAVFQMRIRIQL